MRGGLNDLSVSRSKVKWGIPFPGAPGPRRLRLARRARQLHHRARLRLGGRPPLPRVLGPPGGRARPRHRQGHPALPRRLLAGLPDVGGAPAADDGLGARLVAARREEGVQVRRQHRAPRPARRATSGPTRCATSCCARWPSARTPPSRTRRFSARYNADLANDLGNTVSRVAALCRQSFGGDAARGLHRQRRACAPRAAPAPSGRRRWRTASSTGRSRRSGSS